MELFPGGVAVRGFPWCKDEHQTIGAASLGSKRLCRHHNTKLSKTDSAALSFFRALRDQVDAASRPPVRVIRNNFERWFLKTAINLSLAGTVAVWPRTYGSEEPVPSELVRIAFGRTFFKEPAGLYLFSHPTRLHESKDAVHAGSYLDSSGQIVAFVFEFGGMPALLWVGATGPPKAKLWDRYSIQDFKYRQSRLRLKLADAAPELIFEFA